MKRVVFSINLLMLYIISFAQVPESFNYQAIPRNASGGTYPDQAMKGRFSILSGSPTGTEAYVETFSATTSSLGILDLQVGKGTQVSGTFSTINWGGNSYYLKIEIDPTGGTSYVEMGTTQLLSVPYALYAKTSGHYVGELYGGGIIVAVWRQGGVEHGLIASLVDISASAAWSNITEEIGVSAQSEYEGQVNTNAIIAQSGHIVSAAKLCDDYSSDGFGDWYLPAVWELEQCKNVTFIVNTILSVTNGFQSDYWSSTELSGGSAYLDGWGFTNKTSSFRVRAVRRF